MTPSPTPSPTPTPEPEDNNDDNDSSGDNNNDSAVGGIVESQGQVLGATTYAETGVVEDALMTLVGLSGAGMTAAGFVMNAKKQEK